MTRLLITGAGGFLGSHILEHTYHSTDWDVVCVDSFRDNGITDRISAAVPVNSRVEVVTHDLAAPISSLTARRIGPVDMIVDAASRCSVDESIRDPAAFVANNVACTLTVLEYARQYQPAARILHVSTDEVHGGKEGEEARHWPSSPYSASKAAQEDLCHAWARTYDTRVSLFTSANMFGERQSQLAFIPKLIRAAITGDTIQVHVPGSRRYTYVRNTAHAILRTLTTERNHTHWRYTLPGQELVRNEDIAAQVEILTGKPIIRVTVAADTARPGHDTSYEPLPREQDWELPYTFEEGLSCTVEWAMAAPEWVLS